MHIREIQLKILHFYFKATVLFHACNMRKIFFLILKVYKVFWCMLLQFVNMNEIFISSLTEKQGHCRSGYLPP